MEKPAHFQTILESESQRLNALCTKWQKIFDSSSNLTDELSGQILLAVGKFVSLIFISFIIHKKNIMNMLIFQLHIL